MDNKAHIQEIRTFNRFYTDLIGLLDNHLLNSDYSLAEARILFELFTSDQVTSSDIIQKLSIDKGYLSRILKKFEKQGLITKKPSGADGRISYLFLTQEGLKVFHALNNASDQQINTLIQNISPVEVKELVAQMKAIMKILQKPGS